MPSQITSKVLAMKNNRFRSAQYRKRKADEIMRLRLSVSDLQAQLNEARSKIEDRDRENQQLRQQLQMHQQQQAECRLLRSEISTVSDLLYKV